MAMPRSWNAVGHWAEPGRRSAVGMPAPRTVAPGAVCALPGQSALVRWIFLVQAILLMILLLSGCAGEQQDSMFIDPSAWAWYWKLLWFVVALPLGVVFVVLGLKNASDGSLLVQALIACVFLLYPCFVIAYSFLTAVPGTAVDLYTLTALKFVGGAAVAAALGSIITNGLDKSAYSQSRSHEWRYLGGGRKHSDATNRDVWEHHHGRDSWDKRIRRHRLIWGVLAIVLPLTILINQVPKPSAGAVIATGAAAMLVVVFVMRFFKR